MDLHLSGPEPTNDEKAAVDAALGPAMSAWSGGRRNVDAEGRITLLGNRDARSRRDLALPALHAVQDRFGWLPQGAMNYISLRLQIPPAELYGVATFYHLFSTKPQPASVMHVCDDIACRIKFPSPLVGEGLGVRGNLLLSTPSPPTPLPPGERGVRNSPCLGMCEKAPVSLHIHAGNPCRMSTIPPCDSISDLRSSIPQFQDSNLKLIHRIGHIDPASLEAYKSTNGYTALKRAIELGPEGVIREVLESKLMGRGGAAFPTGRKWEAVLKAQAKPHYLVCNADESEPGTFKDRLLMEGDPFAIIEGMTIAAYATGCERGFIYIRGEYPLAIARIQKAIDVAREAGLLGDNVMSAGFKFHLEIRRGAGAYICGEETALFNSIEGKRGEPRNKPPFPVHSGLFGKPTVINNVETLVNIPVILREGGAKYASYGTAASAGIKLFCVSGHVTKPGLYEYPFGVTLGQLLDAAGGVRTGHQIQAILLGGAAGAFVGPDQLDMPLTFEGTRAAGATLGSGVVMVFDETVDMKDILARIAAFFRDESCGQCVPCRVGTVRQEELFTRLKNGTPLGSVQQELELFQEIAQVMRDASICGLGHTAASAIDTAIKNLKVFGK